MNLPKSKYLKYKTPLLLIAALVTGLVGYTIFPPKLSQGKERNKFIPNRVDRVSGELSSHKDRYRDAINWAPNFATALERARDEGKPIFVGGSSRKNGSPYQDKYCYGFRLMRYRVLENKEAVELINKKTIPVRLDITDHGFPEEIRALSRWRAFLEQSPWPRLGFGHWFMLGAEGEHVFATDVNYYHQSLEGQNMYPRQQSLARIQEGVDLFSRYKKLKQTGNLPALKKLLARVDGAANRYYDSATNLNAMTLRYLKDQGPMPFELVMNKLTGAEDLDQTISKQYGISLPEQKRAQKGEIVPGFREAVIHSLGRFILREGKVTAATRRWMARMNGLPTETSLRKIYASPGWRQSERVAARGLSKLTGVDFGDSENADQYLARAREWWMENREKPEFEIRWSDNLRHKYSFVF